MHVAVVRAGLSALLFSVVLSACHGAAPQSAGSFVPANSAERTFSANLAHLGRVLTTKDGGQIFGFDVNQNGNNGILASSGTTNKPGVYRVSIETFDQNTGTITGVFAAETGSTNSYAVDGIFTGDDALVTHFVSTGLTAKRLFNTISPATTLRFTGNWTPPSSLGNIDIQQVGVNQTTATNVVFASHYSRFPPTLAPCVSHPYHR